MKYKSANIVLSFYPTAPRPSEITFQNLIYIQNWPHVFFSDPGAPCSLGVCFFFFPDLTFFPDHLIMQRTLRLLLPMLPLHFLINTLQSHLAPSQMQNMKSRFTRHFVSLALINDMKARLRLLRQVKISCSTTCN